MRVAAIAFLGGILLLQQCAALPSLWWALALVPAVLLAVRQPRWSVVAFFVAGFVWACLRAELILHERLPSALEGRDLVVEGHVAELPRPTAYGSRFAFDVARARAGGECRSSHRVSEPTPPRPRGQAVRAEGAGEASDAGSRGEFAAAARGCAVSVPPRIRLSAGHGVAPRAGESWRFTVRLKRPHGLQNPGGFDYEGYLFRERVRATGYVRDAPAPERLGEGGGLYRIHRWRQALGERMHALMPGRAHAGLVVALANGDRGGITDAQWETLRRTGTVHLVAISGLHISLVAGVVYWLVKILWAWPGATVLRLPAPLAGATGGLIAAGLYAALAGFVIPTQRALIMLAVALGAVLLRRRVAPGRLLAAALLLVLLFDPLSVMAPGFWLSFAAVALIVYVMYGERIAPALWRKWGYLQWAIALGMFPLTLWWFQQSSLVAPAANLLAVPVFELLVVPLTLLGAFAVGVGADLPAAWLFRAGEALVGGLWHALAWLGALDYAQWTQHRPAAWTLACGLVGVALLLAPRGWPGRAVGAVWLLPLFLVRPAAPAPGEVWFTLLDVGQGLAAVVRTERHALLYDAGPRWSARADAGRTVVVPYLRARGIARLDALLVSHGDNDHAGGVDTVLASLPVARVLSGAPEVAGEPCRAGRRWRWDGVDFAVLGPQGEPSKDNDASCVLRVRAPHGTVLLPGDIERTAEQSLLEREGAGLRADVLVAPHHGSRTSSGPEFLDAVQPRHVAFPVGYRNRYRHPHPLVVRRYHEAGSRLYASPATGALQFRLKESGIEVRAYRERAWRYWFTPVASP